MMTSKKIIKEIDIEMVIRKTVGRRLSTYDTWDGS